jgi:hypothetical protein
LNRLLSLVSLLVLVGAAWPDHATAATQRNFGGNDPQQVEENARKAGFEYPTSELKCSQRCSQWWEKR